MTFELDSDWDQDLEDAEIDFSYSTPNTTTQRTEKTKSSLNKYDDDDFGEYLDLGDENDPFSGTNNIDIEENEDIGSGLGASALLSASTPITHKERERSMADNEGRHKKKKRSSSTDKKKRKRDKEKKKKKKKKKKHLKETENNFDEKENQKPRDDQYTKEYVDEAERNSNSKREISKKDDKIHNRDTTISDFENNEYNNDIHFEREDGNIDYNRDDDTDEEEDITETSKSSLMQTAPASLNRKSVSFKSPISSEFPVPERSRSPELIENLKPDRKREPNSNISSNNQRVDHALRNRNDMSLKSSSESNASHRFISGDGMEDNAAGESHEKEYPDKDLTSSSLFGDAIYSIDALDVDDVPEEIDYEGEEETEQKLKGEKNDQNLSWNDNDRMKEKQEAIYTTAERDQSNMNSDTNVVDSEEYEDDFEESEYPSDFESSMNTTEHDDYIDDSNLWDDVISNSSLSNSSSTKMRETNNKNENIIQVNDEQEKEQRDITMNSVQSLESNKIKYQEDIDDKYFNRNKSGISNIRTLTENPSEHRHSDASSNSERYPHEENIPLEENHVEEDKMIGNSESIERKPSSIIERISSFDEEQNSRISDREMRPENESNGTNIENVINSEKDPQENLSSERRWNKYQDNTVSDIKDNNQLSSSRIEERTRDSFQKQSTKERKQEKDIFRDNKDQSNSASSERTQYNNSNINDDNENNTNKWQQDDGYETHIEHDHHSSIPNEPNRPSLSHSSVNPRHDITPTPPSHNHPHHHYPTSSYLHDPNDRIPRDHTQHSSGNDPSLPYDHKYYGRNNGYHPTHPHYYHYYHHHHHPSSYQQHSPPYPSPPSPWPHLYHPYYHPSPSPSLSLPSGPCPYCCTPPTHPYPHPHLHSHPYPPDPYPTTAMPPDYNGDVNGGEHPHYHHEPLENNHKNMYNANDINSNNHDNNHHNQTCSNNEYYPHRPRRAWYPSEATQHPQSNDGDGSRSKRGCRPRNDGDDHDDRTRGGEGDHNTHASGAWNRTEGTGSEGIRADAVSPIVINISSDQVSDQTAEKIMQAAHRLAATKRYTERLEGIMSRLHAATDRYERRRTTRTCPGGYGYTYLSKVIQDIHQKRK